MIECYDKCIEGGFPVGQSLWDYLPHCGNPIHYYDYKSQETIKKYNYCTELNIPPCKSLDETPYRLLEDFMIIKNEIIAIQKSIKKKDK